ncbi:MAG: hypothetical protein U0521_22645 [Anaerolineae bacterium]
MSNQEIADHFATSAAPLLRYHQVHHILSAFSVLRLLDTRRIAIESGLTLDEVRQSG